MPPKESYFINPRCARKEKPPPHKKSSSAPCGRHTYADISVVVTTAPAFCATRGKTLDFIVVASNSGPSAAYGARLNIPIPDTLRNLLYSADGGVTWDKWTGSLSLGLLPPNAHRVINLREMLVCGKLSEITLTAEVYSSTPEINRANNTYSVTIAVF